MGDGVLPVELQELVDLFLTHWAMELFTTFQTSATYSNSENTLLKKNILLHTVVYP
jgi:hypothetical protein